MTATSALAHDRSEPDGVAGRSLDWPARGPATDQVPLAAPGDRTGDVRRSLMGERFFTASMVVVIEGGLLRGLVSAEDLLAAPEDTLVSAVMDPTRPGCHRAGTRSWRRAKPSACSLAVVDDVAAAGVR